MTLRIDISPELEARLNEAASRRGVDATQYARQLIESHIVATATSVRDQATLDLLAQWETESKTLTPDEIALAEHEWAEFRQAMNEDSLSGRPVYP